MAKAAAGVNSGLSNIGKGLVGGIVGGLAIGGLDQIIGRLGSVVKGVADVGRESRRAGVSTKSFQELSYVADVARVPVDALTDSLKELSIRGDEFAMTGKGGGADAFQRLGYSAAQLKDKLRDPSALLTEIFDKVQRLDKAAQIRIFDELFGGAGGERLVELLNKGGAGLRQMIEEANDLGVVLDEKLIADAERLDEQFAKIGKTVGTFVKTEIVQFATEIDNLVDKFRKLEDRQSTTIKARLADIYTQRDKLQGDIADPLVGELFKAGAETRLKLLTEEAMRLRDVLDRRDGYSESFVFKAGKDADDAAPKVDTLNNALDAAKNAGGAGASGLKSFGDAIRDLKNEIPGLIEGLAELDAESRIGGAYQAAISKARSVGEVMQATALRDEAVKALGGKGAREAGSKSMLDLIGYAEGTDKGRGYNETLGYGAFTGGRRNLVTMTLDEVQAMQKQMLAHPENGFNSSAVGRYQIVGKTMKGLMAELGLSGKDTFDANMQDRMATQLLRRRGNNVGGLRNEWEGLRRIDPDTIRSAYDGSSGGGAIPRIDAGVESANAEAAQKTADATKRRIDLATEQAESYRQIIAGSREFTAAQGTEREALSLGTQQGQALRYERDMLNSAQRDGIVLTGQQRAEIAALAQQMATAEASVSSYAATQQEAAAVSQFFGSQMVDGLAGIIDGSQTAEQALQGMLKAMIKATLQAALMGSGPLASLFGGGKAGMGIFGKLLGFASGGHVRGAGTGTSDSIPARLSDGEFVVRASQTRKHRALLEAINSGHVPAFAAGGVVGTAPRFAAPKMAGGGGSTSISISAPITIEGGGGTPAQNDDLAKRTRREMEGLMRGVVSDELRKQRRAGGSLGR